MDPTPVHYCLASCPASSFEREDGKACFLEYLVKSLIVMEWQGPYEKVQPDNEFLPRHFGLGWPSIFICVLATSIEKNAKCS